jgi:hypothetical protein
MNHEPTVRLEMHLNDDTEMRAYARKGDALPLHAEYPVYLCLGDGTTIYFHTHSVLRRAIQALQRRLNDNPEPEEQP